jgi:diacylglycerol kinase (ATP)
MDCHPGLQAILWAMPELRFVVNVASGGRQGRAVLADLQGRFGPERAQRFDPQALEALLRACQRTGAVVIACGGDGTVAAVLEAGVRTGARVPVGVLPLGTGNDLARVLRWPLRPRWAHGELDLSDFADAVSVPLDRWVLTQASAGTAAAPAARGWYNYLSLGYDARVASRFHALRRHHPGWFRSALVNRALYGLVSLGESASALDDCVQLHRACPQALKTPPWATALLLASIPSYAGGVRLHPCIRADDGRLDVFALPPVAGLSLAMGGLRQLRPLGSVAGISLRLTRAIAMQIDGEPMRAARGDYAVSHGGVVQVLAPRAPTPTSR